VAKPARRGVQQRYVQYVTGTKCLTENSSDRVPVTLEKESRSFRIAYKPIASLAVFAVLGAAPALAASTTPAAPSARAGKTTAAEHALSRSPQLWATIDVCNPSDQPNTLGVRGSMPGDNHLKDQMYMRFRLQYLDSSSKHWVDLANGADSGFVAVGAAKSARQTGRSFQLVPVAGKPAVSLRGVVSFQWRRGSAVVYTISRPTTAGHKSLAGADPANFSAAGCLIS
jgi:hypothetical protein